VTWTDWLNTGSAAAVGVSALIASGSYLARTVGSLMESRRRSRRVWPIRSVSASHRGPSGESVPAGDYRCPRDLHELDVSYETATAKCSACGRRYTVMFTQAGS
jgi:hypothetical protein